MTDFCIDRAISWNDPKHELSYTGIKEFPKNENIIPFYLLLKVNIYDDASSSLHYISVS